MGCKKVVVCSLLVGMLAGALACYMSSSTDYKIRMLKRRANCLNRKINRALNNMSEENVKKYKDELVKGYENIKQKIDNLTVKDIKEMGNDVIESIIEHINCLKEKLITYAK